MTRPPAGETRTSFKIAAYEFSQLELTGKCVSVVRGSEPGPLHWVSWSGCGGEGDGVAEGFELADVAADLAVGVDGGDVVVRAEVVVAGGAVGEQVPDDDEQGAGDGDECFELAAAADQAAVAFAEEGAGFAGGCGGVAEDAFETSDALSLSSRDCRVGCGGGGEG